VDFYNQIVTNVHATRTWMPNPMLHSMPQDPKLFFVEFEKFQSYEFDLVCHHSVMHHIFPFPKEIIWNLNCLNCWSFQLLCTWDCV
jgi:hypothetical protein